jgi:hypothetical protein
LWDIVPVLTLNFLPVVVEEFIQNRTMRCHQATHAFTNSLADFSAESRAWELKLATYVSNDYSEVTPEKSLIVQHTQLLKQGSAEWHKARQGKLTASSFGAASGLSKYVTPSSFWLKATGKIKETYSDQHQRVQSLSHTHCTIWGYPCTAAKTQTESDGCRACSAAANSSTVRSSPKHKNLLYHCHRNDSVALCFLSQASPIQR